MGKNDSSDKSALERLATVLSRYSPDPSTETREVEYTEEVEREVTKEKTFTETVEEDRGPHPVGYVLLIGGILLGVGFAVAGKIGAGILGAACGGAVGGAALYWWRRVEEKTIERTEEIPDTVVEEVVRTREVEEEVSSSDQIVRAGRATLSFSAAKTPYGCLVQGPDGVMASRTVSFPTIDRPSVVYKATESAEEAVSEIPWVLDGSVANYEVDWDSAQEETPSGADQADYEDDVPLRGEERALRDYFQVVESAFADLDDEPVEVVSLKNPDLFGELAPLLERVGEACDPDLPLHRLLEGEGGLKLERFARQWEERWTQINVALLEARSESLFEQVGPACYELGTQVGYGAFNFYCPHCNEQQQEELLERSYGVHEEEPHEPVRYSDTTRCVFRPEEEVWQCRTCERETEDPIPIHRMLDEVLFPAYDHLMQENKNERLRIHAKARDQERDLQEKAESELDSIRREHMSKIFSLSEEMERFQADIAGEREAIESMQDLLDEYEVAQEESVASIEQFSEKVHDKIQSRTEQVLKEVDTVKKREMEALAQELDELSKAQRIEDRRRDAILSEIAENTERTAEASERTAQATERTAEATERTAEATERTAKAAERTAEASEQQVREQRRTTRSVRENTEATKEVGTELGQKLDKQTAIRKAEQRQLDLETDKYGKLRHPIRTVLDAKDELVGTISGRAQEKTEAQKLGNA